MNGRKTEKGFFNYRNFKRKKRKKNKRLKEDHQNDVGETPSDRIDKRCNIWKKAEKKTRRRERERKK